MKNTLTSRRIEARRTAVANAIATQRLAGIEINAQTPADMDRYAQGEINLPEVLAQLRQRVAASELAEAVQDFEDLYIAEQRLAVLHSGESCSIPSEELTTAL